MKVLVTGATGFVGLPLVRALAAAGYGVVAVARRPGQDMPGVERRVVEDLAKLDIRDLVELLAGCEAVVHAAAIAHIGKDVPAERYRAVNQVATGRLAEAAAISSIRRFVFVSSIRAQSGPSAAGVLTEETPARPTDAYGASKLEAERLVAAHLPEAVILRPTLVAGPGARGNLAALMKVAETGLPLPVGGLAGKRSLVSLDSLVAAILRGLDPSLMPPGCYIVCDEPPLTLAEMLAEIAAAGGRPSRVFGLPSALLGPLCRLLGKGDAFERVSGSLVASAAKLKATGWEPAMTARQAIKQMTTTIPSPPA
jgi:UDP-glucose 4-epimerase